MVQKLKITPTEFVVKKDDGTISYAAGTDSTGTPYPAYLRSMTASETYDTSSIYQIYYNQIAPAPYPVDNLNVPITSIPACAGAIHAILAVSSTTGLKLSDNVSDRGVYLMVPTKFAGNATDFLNSAVSSIGTVYTDAYTFMEKPVAAATINFQNGTSGIFGPWDNTARRLIYVAIDSAYFSNANYSTGIIALSSNYDTSAQTAYVATDSVTLTQNITFTGTLGIVKIMFYSKGSQVLRFTKW